MRPAISTGARWPISPRTFPRSGLQWSWRRMRTRSCIAGSRCVARCGVPHDAAAEREALAAYALLPALFLDGGLPGVHLRSAAAPLAAPRVVLSTKRTDLQRRGHRGVLRPVEPRGPEEGAQRARL